MTRWRSCAVRSNVVGQTRGTAHLAKLNVQDCVCFPGCAELSESETYDC